MSASTLVSRLTSEARRSRSIMISGGILLGIAITAIIGPVLSPHSYLTTNFDGTFIEPTIDRFNLFGTDDLGRDVFVRTLMGIQVTLLVAIIASIVSLVIGVAYGAIAGYVGGRIDAVMMRAVDALYALPFIFLVILLMVVFERNFLLIFVALCPILVQHVLRRTQNVFAIEHNLSRRLGVLGQQSHDRQCRLRLAGPRFAHQAD